MTEQTDSSRVEEPSLKDSPQRWFLLVLLNLGLLFCYVHRSSLSVAAPFIIKDLGLNTAITGILLSAFFWPYAFMQTPAGWIVDRIGVRVTYAVGFVLGCVATAATGLARGTASLILVRMTLGVGQSALFPASLRASANWFREQERGIVTALFLTGNRIGQALINGIGAILLTAIGWKMFFSALGLLPLIFLLPWMLFLRKWERPSLARSEASLVESFALMKQKTALGIFLGFFAYDYVWFLFLTWLPAYLVIERHCTTSEVAIFSSIPYLIGPLITVPAGALSDWFVRRGYEEIRVRKVFICAGLAIGCFIVPAGIVQDKMTSVYFLMASLCGLNVSAPSAWSLTQAAVEKRIVGTVAGIQNFGGNLGGIIAPALTGYIAHLTGSFALALSVAGALLVAGIFAYWLMIVKQVELTVAPLLKD